MALERIVLLVGGVGGAKLAYGLSQVLSAGQLKIIVNTGDDFWHYGLRICPDLDTILYTLSGRVDKRQGWGIANDTTQLLDSLRLYGQDVWFRLGDMDLATHLLRTHQLQQGHTLTAVMSGLAESLDIPHSILPMTNDEVATVVETKEYGSIPFQSYFVKHRWQPTVKSLTYQGAANATATAQARSAINESDAIIIGPSNPWLSIAPILAVQDLRDALLSANVPRVAVSPIVAGQAIKGPTAKIMEELGMQPSAAQVGRYYGTLINGFIYDQSDTPPDISGLRTTAQQTVMRSDRDKIALAESLLTWIEDWRN